MMSSLSATQWAWCLPQDHEQSPAFFNAAQTCDIGVVMTVQQHEAFEKAGYLLSAIPSLFEFLACLAAAVR
jgi:hypothetical protein